MNAIYQQSLLPNFRVPAPHSVSYTPPRSANAVISLSPSLHAYVSASFVIVGVGVGDSNELISELHPHFRVVGFAAAGG